MTAAPESAGSRTTTPLVSRLRPFTSTIFAEMSALAVSTGAINLGQGFPDSDGPASMLLAAQQAIADGVNQYPPGPGIPELRRAIATSRSADHGQVFDPDSEVLVTAGATEAIAAAVIGLVEPGEEVIVLEPFYDSYPAVVAMAGAHLVPVPLRQRTPGGRFALDPQRLADAVSGTTRLILLNTPHNPTGTVLTPTELEQVAAVAIEHDLLVVTDEVYEHLVFDDADGRPARHIPIGTLPGMAERTVTISSAGKTFNATGWKIGWACGPAALVAAVRAAKQFLTFVNGAPFQPAVAHALTHEREWIDGLRNSLQDKRNRLVDGLTRAGFDVVRPEGTYFVVADIRPLISADGGGGAAVDEAAIDGAAFCRTLPDRCGVVAVPQQAFYADPADGAHLVRFAFCKQDAVIDEAVRRLSGPIGNEAPCPAVPVR